MQKEKIDTNDDHIDTNDDHMEEKNAEGISFHQIADALFYFEEMSISVIDGTMCKTSDGKFIFKNGEWWPCDE